MSDVQPNSESATQQRRYNQNLPYTRRYNKPKEPKPTHFLALQLSQHDTVTTAISSIQSSITSHSSHLAPSLVDPATAHLTLGVLHLPENTDNGDNGEGDEDHLSTILQATLQRAVSRMGLTFPLPVQLHGVGNFRNSVVFLKVSERAHEDVVRVAQAARTEFKESGLLVQAHRQFQPHVTCAKLSKMLEYGGGSVSRSGSEGWRNDDAGPATSIPPESYQQHRDITTDVVCVSELQVCAMQQRQPGEYYNVISRINLLSQSD